VGGPRTAIRATLGKFVTVEGIEGVGKSTNMNRLAAAIEAAGHRVLKTREPGGTPTAEEIRNIVLGHADEAIPPMAELLLMFAARALHVDNVIRPALAAGTWVVSDRFVDASRAYQSGGRGVPMSRVDELANWVVGDLVPDLTILLDAPVRIALARTRARGAPDRLDAETAEFYERVRSTYLALAAAEPRRFAIVDAGAELPEVAAEIDRIAWRLTAPSS
jgi:dTMP kinase